MLFRQALQSIVVDELFIEFFGIGKSKHPYTYKKPFHVIHLCLNFPIKKAPSQ